MKLTIRLPAGLEVAFEGDDSEFERFSQFITRFPEFVESLGPVAPPELGTGGDDQNDNGGAGNDGDPLDPKVLNARLERVGAKNHIERVTVMAQAAVES